MNTYEQVVTKHNTKRFQNSHGSVSIRKVGQRYRVYVDDWVERKTIVAYFATLRGAEINFEYYKRYYL